MEEVYLAEHLLKVIRERQDLITVQMVRGSIKDIEQYRHLVGSMESLQFISDEILVFLEKAHK